MGSGSSFGRGVEALLGLVPTERRCSPRRSLDHAGRPRGRGHALAASAGARPCGPSAGAEPGPGGERAQAARRRARPAHPGARPRRCSAPRAPPTRATARPGSAASSATAACPSPAAPARSSATSSPSASSASPRTPETEPLADRRSRSTWTGRCRTGRRPSASPSPSTASRLLEVLDGRHPREDGQMVDGAHYLLFVVGPEIWAEVLGADDGAEAAAAGASRPRFRAVAFAGGRRGAGRSGRPLPAGPGHQQPPGPRRPGRHGPHRALRRRRGDPAGPAQAEARGLLARRRGARRGAGGPRVRRGQLSLRHPGGPGGRGPARSGSIAGPRRSPSPTGSCASPTCPRCPPSWPSVRAMAQVPTVTGSIDTADLGPTLMHEHVFVLSPEIIQNYGDYWDDEERIADGVAKLNDLAARGIHSIVDPTVIGLGRYLPWVQRVAEQVDLQIVAATGLYTYNDVPFYFHYRGLHLRHRSGPDDRDVREGHHRGHRRHRGEGGDPQVRHRRRRPDPRRRAGPAGLCPGPPRDRGADHHPHRCGHVPGPGPAAGVRRGGRRPQPGRHRPLRRLHRPRLPRGADGQGLDDRHGPLRRRRPAAPSTTGCRWWPTCAPRATPTAWSWPTTPPATWTGSPPRCSRPWPPTGTSTTSPTTSCPSC